MVEWLFGNSGIFFAEIKEIKSVTSVLTIVDGRVVYGAQEYINLTPKLPEPLPVWSSIKYFGGYYNSK